MPTVGQGLMQSQGLKDLQGGLPKAQDDLASLPLAIRSAHTDSKHSLNARHEPGSGD